MGQAEAVVRAEYGEVACQIRMDWFDTTTGITDLKTVDALDYFEADARRYGYVHQLAFYRGVLHAACGLKYTCQFIAVEKKEPFRVGVWLVTGDLLDYAERENLAAIKRLRQCETEARWPTGYEDLRFFDSL